MHQFQTNLQKIMIKKSLISASDKIALQLKILDKEKEDARRKLAVTAEKLRLKAKQLAVTAKEKEIARRKLQVTAEKLRLKAKQLAVTAKEKEDTKRKLEVTAKELRLKAKQLAIVAKEKEDVRRKLVVTAKKLKQSYDTLEKKVLERTKDLEQLRARDEAILQSIGDGLVVADTEGKIMYVNNAFEEMVGWKTDEVLGKHIVTVVPREDEKGDVVLFKERILTQVLAGEKVIADLTKPFYYIRKDKTRFPASSIVTSIVLKGKKVGIVEAFRDITKEKESDRAKTEFMSLASHQLRTPLTEIRWALSSLKREELPDEQSRVVKVAYEAVVHMAEIIKKMLMISRLEADDVEARLSDVDVQSTIEKIARLSEMRRQRNELELTIHCPEGLCVRTDELLFTEILSNLLSNAYKYTPKGGKIHVDATQVSKKIRIDVADTGYGIPEAEQGKIAQKFFRASNIAERDESGTGIGLYMAYSTAKLMGGSISFVSKENKGTVFTLLFPAC